MSLTPTAGPSRSNALPALAGWSLLRQISNSFRYIWAGAMKVSPSTPQHTTQHSTAEHPHSLPSVTHCGRTSSCSSLGIDSAQYVARVNTEYQKVGACDSFSCVFLVRPQTHHCPRFPFLMISLTLIEHACTQTQIHIQRIVSLQRLSPDHRYPLLKDWSARCFHHRGQW